MTHKMWRRSVDHHKGAKGWNGVGGPVMRRSEHAVSGLALFCALQWHYHRSGIARSDKEGELGLTEMSAFFLNRRPISFVLWRIFLQVGTQSEV